MEERYQVTDQDISSVEANLLPMQAELSRKHLQVREKLEELGVEGMLWSDHSDSLEDDEPYYDLIEGELNGHFIPVKTKGSMWVRGEIDGKRMSEDRARDLLNKYKAIAQIITKDELYAARRELATYTPRDPEHEEADILLKDIL